MTGQESLFPASDRGTRQNREVYGGGDNPHGYYYRARIEKRAKRGRDQWRFVGEQKYITWRDRGPGFNGMESRWFKDLDQAIKAANAWLDQMAYNPRKEAEGYV